MKIAGYTYYNNQLHYTMKCDASLLNQRKPFFVPDWAKDFRYIPCRVARISRLGRSIEARFANRYYDAVATGLDFVAYDLLDSEWAQATAFDNSLCVGDWQNASDATPEDQTQIAWAIEAASQQVTLRMGDLIYIDHAVPAVAILPEQVIEQNLLYCKIK